MGTKDPPHQGSQHSTVLQYLQHNLHVIAQVDASQDGLGAS